MAHKTSRHSEYGKAVLIELQATCTALFSEAGFDTNLADQLSNELAYRLSESWGGTMIYIPKRHQFVATRRDEEIYEAYAGDVQPLVRQFGLSKPYLYKIIRRMKELKQRKQQLDMFTQETSS